MNEQEAIKRLEYIKHVGNGEQEYKHCAEEIALDMAIKALEKQIAKKVNKETKDSYGNVIPRCPSCSKMFVEDYCSKCGQKIDWTVEE